VKVESWRSFAVDLVEESDRAKSQYKDAFDKLAIDYPKISALKGNPNITNPNNNRCGTANEFTPLLRIYGIGFWDDVTLGSTPKLFLEPILLVQPMEGTAGPGGGSGGSGGTGGTGGSTPSIPVEATIVLPDTVLTSTIPMTNSDSTTVAFSTFIAREPRYLVVAGRKPKASRKGKAEAGILR
jgi:hypothetical protein